MSDTNNVTPPADDRVHSATENEQAIENDEKLNNADLTEDEKDRAERHY